jgi:hypothetical protein
MSSRLFIKLGILLLIVANQSVSLAQIKWPKSSENLQVLPKNTKIEELRKIMGSFTEGLGVRCSDCHFMSDPKDVSTFDFASDKMLNKNIARKMIKMVANLNDGTISEIAEMSKEKNPVYVNCYTCHRGYQKPILLEDVLYTTVTDSGTAAAINQYKKYRERYYGQGTFNFDEESLVKLSNKLAQDNRPNDAIPFLKLNTELNPDSPFAFEGLSEGYIKAGDYSNAVSSAETVISLLDKSGKNNDRGSDRLRKQAQETINKYKK